MLAEITDGVPLVRADTQRLEQVVSNLLGNAVRHTPPGGLVAAAVFLDGTEVHVEVRDTGEGITIEEAPHLFERFFSAEYSSSGCGKHFYVGRKQTSAC